MGDIGDMGVECAMSLLPPQSEIVIPHAMLDLLSGERLPHAVLLVGTEAATRACARYIGQVLLCESNERPCGRCSTCLQFVADVCADFREVGGESIRKGDIESLQGWLAVKGHRSRKVYTLYGADTMTGVAANRILKTLEEPDPGVHAILTAVSRQAVLSTITSRSFTFTVESSEQFLHSDYQVIPLLQAALHPSENDTFDGFIPKMVRWTRMWLVEHMPSLLLAAEWQSICSEVSADSGLMLLVEWLRDILHTRIGQLNIRFRAWAQDIAEFAPMLEVAGWASALDIVLDSRLRLKSNVVALLNFEQMCIRLQGGLSDV